VEKGRLRLRLRKSNKYAACAGFNELILTFWLAVVVLGSHFFKGQSPFKRKIQKKGEKTETILIFGSVRSFLYEGGLHKFFWLRVL